MTKTIWLREEIPIADELLALAPKLTEEFLQYHDDFIVGDFKNGKPYSNPHLPVSSVPSRAEAWKIDPLKYTYPLKNVAWHLFKDNDIRNRFPTAVALTEKYGTDCPISSYSIIEANAIIQRHTGPENRDNEFLRIHIPLIIPEGDIFFEVEGIEIDWSDLFGFDNQKIHSAHNHSPHRRLVYLIDISRTRLGIPIGEKYNPIREGQIPPFVRGAVPKLLHTKQRI
jgi:Aspartyl/Asparaginyl beta-hydroxylase